MARWLTPIRAGLLAVAVGLLAGAAIRPDALQFGGRRDAELPETEERRRADRHLVEAFTTWRMAAVADSVLATIEANTSATAIVVGHGIPDRISETVRRVTESSPTPVTPAPGSYLVAMALDTVSTFDGGSIGWFAPSPEIVHLLPATPEEPCVSIVLIRRAAATSQSRRLERDLRGLVPGICGIVAAFGHPGRHVREWLVATDGVPAHVLSRERHPSLLEEGTRVSILDFLWLGRLELDPEVRCFAGRREDCEAWIRQPMAANRADSITIGGRDLLINSLGWRARLPAYFASDLINLRGPERFAAFWSSDRPVDEAFQAAYGETLGSGVSGWLRELGMDGPRELRSPARDAPPMLMLMLLAVAASLVYVSRRTVSA
jgi:hypothetical protein